MHELNFTGRKGNQALTVPRRALQPRGYQGKRNVTPPLPTPSFRKVSKVITGTAIQCDRLNLTGHSCWIELLKIILAVVCLVSGSCCGIGIWDALPS